jgi:hypothetical protein
MHDPQFIKRFLKLNEISADATDEQIVAVLKRAKWTDDEISTALTLVRGNPVDVGVVAVSKKNMTLFRPDMNFSSERLSSLLGVDVVIDPTKVRDAHSRALIDKRRAHRELLLWALVITLSTILATVVLWTMFYFMELGPYHTAVER